MCSHAPVGCVLEPEPTLTRAHVDHFNRLETRTAAVTRSFQRCEAREIAMGQAEQKLRQRLARHADAIATVVGLDAAPSDLQYLTDEDIVKIGSEMTRIEKMRLQAALQALSGTTIRFPFG